jgi:phosphopantetheinyl transferase (holo-ACP synthase)
MIGNDVVDLAQRSTQPGARHPRFDARVFGARERALIGADATQRVRWVLWAAKEAAYKAAKKLDAALVWAPARFEVSLDSRTSGRVRHGARELTLRIEESDDWVHAIARAEPSAGDERHAVAECSGDGASQAVRAFARACVAAQLGVADERVTIARRGRVPVLCVDRAPARADLSLSHHGRFVAFACELSEPAAAARLAS